jgi:hypothetical protein
MESSSSSKCDPIVRTALEVLGGRVFYFASMSMKPESAEGELRLAHAR